MDKPTVAIVDYGMGNLFSVKNACDSIGLSANITYSKEDILSSDAVILPGVGAFGSAMKALSGLDLIDTLHKAASSKPFIGVCLGMQLLMSESCEFGHHKGLNLIKGSVLHFEGPKVGTGRRLKVPHVGWNRVYRTNLCTSWQNSLLAEVAEGEFMYFVHSYYVQLENSDLALSGSRYGDIEFCSALQYKNIFGCQFHPERSGKVGLRVYKSLLLWIKDNF